MNNNNYSLEYFFSLTGSIEKSSSINDIGCIIKDRLNKIINCEKSAYYLIKKSKFEFVEHININYSQEETKSQITQIRNISLSSQKVRYFFKNKNQSGLGYYRYGAQNKESNYESFLIFSIDCVDNIINHVNVIDLIMPRMHTAAVNIYRDTKQKPCDINYLSPRENEVLHWISEGKTNNEIGLILGISSFTVKNHVSNILEKLNVVNRVAALKKMQDPKYSNNV